MTKEKLTPKYWVVYNHEVNDAITWTLSKTRESTEKSMDVMFYGDWREDPKFEVILIEIVRVEI